MAAAVMYCWRFACGIVAAISVSLSVSPPPSSPVDPVPLPEDAVTVLAGTGEGGGAEGILGGAEAVERGGGEES